MIYKSIKRKLFRTRMSLQHTVQKILDINKKKKRLAHQKKIQRQKEALNEELKLLNKLAEQQARLVRRYEYVLSNRD